MPVRRLLASLLLLICLPLPAAAQPPGPVRMCAEWEPVEGVMIRWPLGISASLVAEMSEDALEREWTPEQGESNPFLHMSMHSAIREQVSIDRPPGVAAVHRQLSSRVGRHEAEHRIMECLARMLWQAQSTGSMPDEQGYLECLRRIGG